MRRTLVLRAKPTASHAQADKPTAESLGHELLGAMPSLRMHSVSLHDEEGDVSWLSEGALGPDEHSAVLEAMSTFGLEPDRTAHAISLGDGRSAAFLPARSPGGDLVGVAMIVVDTKALATMGEARLVTAQSRAIMQRFATLLAPAPVAAPPLMPASPPAAPAKPVATVLPSKAPALAPAPAQTQVQAQTQARPVIELCLEPEADDSARPRYADLDAQALAPAPKRPSAKAPAAPVRPAPAPAPTVPAPAAPKAPAAAAAPARRKAEDTVSLPKPSVPKPVEPELDIVLDAIDLTPSMAIALSKDQAAMLASAARKETPALRPSNSPSAANAPSVAGSPTALNPPGAPSPTSEEATLVINRPDADELVLFVQQLLKLRSGGRTRRYEVLLRSREDASRDVVPRSLMQAGSEHGKSSALDRHVLGELLGWLGKHRDFWTSEPSSFSVNVCAGTLADPKFASFVGEQLARLDVPAEMLGFEIAQADCVQHQRHAQAFVEACEKLGCYVVLDDFSLHSDAVPLLASKAVRVVKIDAQLTASAMKDKLSQALVIAISQACKVLGAHCVAKRIDTPAARQWLSAVGIDFAQGFLLEKPTSLDALLASR